MQNRNGNRASWKLRGANRRPRNKSVRAGGNGNPQQHSSNLRFRHKFRFSVPATGYTGGISDTQVLHSTGGITTVTNSTLTNWVQSFKIRKIEIWSAPSTQGAASTVSVEWFGFGNSPSLEVSDTTLSVSRNAHIVAIPPESSLCAFWQKATGTGLFSLVLPAGSVFDMELDLILSDNDALYTVPVTTAVLGNVYYLALDHQVSDLIVPVSLHTTI
jgi:hypothetical protein